MNERPTPETNAMRGEWAEGRFWPDQGGPLVQVEYAERLERERDEAREENAAMREAIREARDVFQVIAEYWNRDQNERAMADACWHTIESAEAALTELQPFLEQ